MKTKTTSKPKVKLTPADPKQCQALIPNGCSFMSFGGVPALVRCTNVPVVIAVENKPSEKDGLRGSMSLCPRCRDKCLEQLGKNYVTMKDIVYPDCVKPTKPGTYWVRTDPEPGKVGDNIIVTIKMETFLGAQRHALAARRGVTLMGKVTELNKCWRWKKIEEPVWDWNYD